MNITAQLIATLIRANTEIYLSGNRSRAEWDREQRRLWDLARTKRVDKPVLRLVMPTLSGAR